METATDFDKLGLRHGQVVQELGWDDDADEDLRQQVMETVDGELIEDAEEAVDVVWLWLRADDGDVADGLVDAMRDLSEGAETAGMVLTSTHNVSDDWQAHKVVRPRGTRR